MKYTIVDMTYAYAAGFFDGEGYIGIRKRDMRYSLVIEAVNKDRSPIQFLKETLGGSITERPPSRGRCLHYRWQLSGLPAATALEKIIPYLVCKKERALLGIRITYTVGQAAEKIRCRVLELNQIHGKGKGL